MPSEAPSTGSLPPTLRTTSGKPATCQNEDQNALVQRSCHSRRLMPADRGGIEDMNPEAVMSALHHAGWSLGEWATDAGHLAEVHRGGHRIIVTARTTTIAWLALWAK